MSISPAMNDEAADISQALHSLQAVLDAQRTAFLSELPVSLETRRDRLDRALAMLMKYREPFLAAITQGDPKAAKQALVAHLEESLTRYRAMLDEPAGSAAEE